MHNPYNIVKTFESAIAEFTGSPYAIAVDSCTNSLFLCCKYLNIQETSIPSFTYVSVPCSIIHAGGKIKFENYQWENSYQLKPYPIWDYSLVLSRNMYVPGQFQCLSFSSAKSLPIGKGGMILTDNKNAAEWFKIARYEGRHECEAHLDKYEFVGWNMYMTPEQAARGLSLMLHLKDNNVTPKGIYQDLSKYPIYK